MSQMSTDEKTKKALPFSPKAELFLAHDVAKHAATLFGKHSPTCTNIIKQKCWRLIAEDMNVNFTDGNRTWDCLRKKYQNMVCCAKKKADALKRPATGGGRKPPDPTPAEEFILQEMSGRPALDGLAGVDTPASSTHPDQKMGAVEVSKTSYPIQIDCEGTYYVDMEASTSRQLLPETLKKCLEMSAESSQDMEQAGKEEVDDVKSIGCKEKVNEIAESVLQKSKKMKTCDLNAYWRRYLAAGEESHKAQAEYFRLKTKLLKKEHSIDE